MLRLPKRSGAGLYCVLLALALVLFIGCDDNEETSSDTGTDPGPEFDLTPGDTDDPDADDQGADDIEVTLPSIGETTQSECGEAAVVVGETTQSECVDPGADEITVGPTSQSSCEGGGVPFISATDQSECTDAPAVSSVVIEECDGLGEDLPDALEVVPGPGRIQVVHRNATHNCCGLIEVDLSVDGNVLTLTENETFDDDHPGCFCLCGFTVSAEITGLAGGAYVVRVVDGGTETAYGEDIDVTVPAPDSVFDAVGGPGTISLTHINAEHTCCVDVAMAFAIDGTTVNVWETETGPPCDCLCQFDLKAEIGGMDAGSYNVQLLNSEGGSAVGDPIAVTVEEADDEIAVDVDQDALTIHHNDATWNCCGAVEMQVSVSESVILVEEVETYPDGDPCRCTCEFDLSVKASGFAPGEYTVMVFTVDPELGDVVFGEVDVSIPGRPTDPIDPVDGVSAEPGGSYSILVLHNNATYNCCSEVAVEAVVDGDVVSVQEVITNDELCHCICNFDLSTEISGLPVGEYTVDVTASDGTLAGSDDVIVNGSGTPPLPPEVVVLARSGSSLVIEHQSVEANCCVEIEMELEADGFYLDITETIVDVESVCDCECVFNLEATITDLDESVGYTVRLWGTDGTTLVHEEIVEAD